MRFLKVHLASHRSGSEAETGSLRPTDLTTGFSGRRKAPPLMLRVSLWEVLA
jgi:hypothetical protein